MYVKSHLTFMSMQIEVCFRFVKILIKESSLPLPKVVVRKSHHVFGVAM